MKYSQIVQDSYSDQIGSVELLGQSVQLCDHMENIDGAYYATSFPLSVQDRTILKDAGAQFGTLSDDSPAVYLTENMLRTAIKPVREGDAMTQAMVTRLIDGLASANAKRNARFA